MSPPCVGEDDKFPFLNLIFTATCTLGQGKKYEQSSIKLNIVTSAPNVELAY